MAQEIQAISRGGGIYLSGLVAPSTVSGNTLEWNIAGHNDDGDGGGMYVDQSEVTIEDNDLFDNSATWAGDSGAGGGLYINGGTVLIQRNVITRNHGASFPGLPSTATGYGGGIAISGSLAIVQGNWIIGNNGTNAEGVGVHVDGNSDVVLYNNTIIVSHTTGIANADLAGSKVGAKYTLYEANADNYGAGVGSSYEIAGPAGLLADYHVGSGSNAIDQAITLTWVTTDIDGDACPIGSTPDVGADEAWHSVFLPLVLRGF